MGGQAVNSGQNFLTMVAVVTTASMGVPPLDLALKLI